MGRNLAIRPTRRMRDEPSADEYEVLDLTTGETLLGSDDGPDRFRSAGYMRIMTEAEGMGFITGWQAALDEIREKLGL